MRKFVKNIIIICFFSFQAIYSNNQDDSTFINKSDSSIVEQYKNNESKEISYFQQFISFISNPFTSAALASILTLLITNLYNNHKKKIEKYNNYKTLLNISKDELKFYVTKLKQLSSESITMIEKIQKNEEPVIPTYSIYPKFLENAKIKFNDFYINTNIINKISYCHFELAHISERLELIKKELRTDYDNDLEISNIYGFNKLIEMDLEEFILTINLLDKEILKY